MEPSVSVSTNLDELHVRIAQLEARLAEADETLQAIRSGEVDALVVSGPDGDQIFALEGADHAYRLLVEQMQEGTVTLDQEGLILYANRQFAAMKFGIVEGEILAHQADEDQTAAARNQIERPGHRRRVTGGVEDRARRLGLQHLGDRAGFDLRRPRQRQSSGAELQPIVAHIHRPDTRARGAGGGHGRVADRTTADHQHRFAFWHRLFAHRVQRYGQRLGHGGN